MKKQYDVIVAGGGPSGVAAAVSAARNGASVLLVEQSSCFGGLGSNGLVPAFCPFTDGEKLVIGGIGYEILQQMKKEMFQNPFWDEGNGIRGLDWVSIDPEVLKRVMDRIVSESGCDILLHTMVVSVKAKDGRLESVQLQNKSGMRSVEAKVFIDCTGDGDLVAMSGGAFEYGDEKGQVQAGTLCFRLANVDVKRFMEYAEKTGEDGNLNVAVKRARQEGNFPFTENNVAGFVLQADGIAGVNFGHIYGIRPLDAESLTAAEIKSREQIPDFLQFLKKYVPGLEQAVVVSTASTFGVRESRRIIGCCRMTKEDYQNRREFKDAIARYSYPIDLHAASEAEVEYGENREFITTRYQPGESYSIPFRALLPKGYRNLIAAGKIISADRAMLSSVRVMPPCFATGEAAGTAAAICSREGTDLPEINIHTLQEQLRKQGGIL